MIEVFTKILNLSITATWIVLAVLLLRLIFKKAPKYIHCLFWCIVGLRLVIPFSFESAISLIPTLEPVDTGVSVSAPSDIGSTVISGSEVSGAPMSDGTYQTPSDGIFSVLSIVWLVGMAVMVAYMLISYILLRRKVSASVKVRSVWVCDGISSPFVLGFLRPRIYVPSHLNKTQFIHVLSHEKAHIKRLDHIWKPIAFCVLSVYWFNPFLWLAYVLLCRDIELACDEKVASSLGTDGVIEYSETLLGLGVTRMKIAACPLAFGEVGIKARVKNVLNYKKPAFWIIAVSLLLGIAAAVCLLTVRPVKESIDSLFHEHDYTSQITSPATCTENGTLTYTCSECDDSYTEEIEKTGHDYTDSLNKAASCDMEGEVVYTCGNCNDSYLEVLEKKEHTYVSEITTAATCAAKGVLTYSCSVCGDSYTEETDYDKTAHSFNYDAGAMLKFVTCTEPGIIEYTCTLCGEKKTDSVPASGHYWDLHTACCVHEGYVELICRFCKIIEKTAADAPDHNWQMATCTAPETCKDCGLTRGEKKGHLTYGGLCDRCNQNIPYYMITVVEGLDMTLLQDGDLFYFSNPRVDYTIEEDRPYIFFTLTSTVEENTKIFYKITVVNERTGNVVHNAGGSDFDRIDPGETLESGVVVNLVTSFDEPGEYRVIFSPEPYCNERVE